MDLVQNGKLHDSNLRWSDEVFRIFGYQPGEIDVSNERFFETVHPDDRASITAAMGEALRDGTEYRLDHRIVMPNGTERFVHEHAEIILDDVSGLPLRMVGTVQDITDRRHLEEQFRQSQKMEAVGVLAGGIAHDFNNLLTAINGYSDLTLKKMRPDDPLRRNIDEVRNAGSRAAELTSQLLAFSRKQVLKSTVLSLNTVISNIEKMLRRIIRESIELRVVLDPDLGNIKADAGQIEQVIMNLAINARDAMPHGGTLTVATQNTFLDETYASQHLAITPGDFVKITVSDTGEGMDAATQPHIFEPFFTTKEVGKGTGLGLSTVYGIVKQSGGDIMVYSELGHGTTFKIYLPRVTDSVQTKRWTGESAQIVVGDETILVVEDEEIVRNLVVEILTGSGYKVLIASSGESALEICKTYTDTIHLLLTDVIMPKMGGSALKDLVAGLRPDIKVLFMSGYTDDAIAHREVYDANIAFIEKPFMPNVLLRKVREVLLS
jgi:PAS domain S-box-containing protein